MLAMGPLVDISVVVLGRSTGDVMPAPPSAAALEGTNAVAVPTLATLTTVAVLLPVTLLSGLAKLLARWRDRSGRDVRQLPGQHAGDAAGHRFVLRDSGRLARASHDRLLASPTATRRYCGPRYPTA
jgi:hypothetical protein